jgi:hypothetical protein
LGIYKFEGDISGFIVLLIIALAIGLIIGKFAVP